MGRELRMCEDENLMLEMEEIRAEWGLGEELFIFVLPLFLLIFPLSFL